MSKKYSMRETMDVAKVASKEIAEYLNDLPETDSVINVEDDVDFRTFDVDLVQVTDNDYVLIEIKGDRYYRTGNYFFETTSNTGKNTLGCFLYTVADFIYYYFVEQKELHILPMPQTSEWFKKNIDRFSEKTASTSVNGSQYYTTGRVVPRDVVMKEVGVKVVSLTKTK